MSEASPMSIKIKNSHTAGKEMTGAGMGSAHSYITDNSAGTQGKVKGWIEQRESPVNTATHNPTNHTTKRWISLRFPHILEPIPVYVVGVHFLNILFF